MKLSMTGQMRLEQRMKLAPRMIQSMEILQLPLLALQERIEAELNSNPVLELSSLEPEDEQGDSVSQVSEESGGDTTKSTEEEQVLILNQDNDKVEDFQRLGNLGDDFDEYMGRAGPMRRQSDSGESDRKLEAMKNTAAAPQSLHEYLTEQWRLVEAQEPVKKAGQDIIDYLDEKGYLTIRIEQLYNKDKSDFAVEDLYSALKLVQKLEPAGVGARDLAECLLIQIAQRNEDMSFESKLVSEYLDELLENHLPYIAKKMNCSPERIYKAIDTLSKLDTSPGLQIGRTDNRPLTAEVIVERSDDGVYTVRLAESTLPSIRISSYYNKMAKNRSVDEKTKQFLQNNIRSAQWLMDAVMQRKKTLLRVARAIVGHQHKFFEKGMLHLKPLPMSKIADELGVHVATVSRAVAGKYVQCPQGILALRKFFTGGTKADDGKSHSWAAIKAKLQQIIDTEDKTKPLGDDEIRDKLLQTGIKKIARRTIAKYRKLLNIPAARFRKKY